MHYLSETLKSLRDLTDLIEWGNLKEVPLNPFNGYFAAFIDLSFYPKAPLQLAIVEQT